MKRFKQKAKDLIASRHLVRGMFIASMLESTIIPIALEPILLPVMQARRDKIWALATAAIVGCIVGSLFGYAIGYYLFDLIEPWVVGNIASQAQLDDAVLQMQEQGFYFVMALGIIPIPLQIAMLAAGATGFSLSLYIIAVAISRAIRYFSIAIVVYYAGNQAEKIIKENKYTVTLLLVLFIALVWWFGALN